MSTPNHQHHEDPVSALKETQIEELEQQQLSQAHPHGNLAFDAPIEHVETLQQYHHVRLSWRSWLAVFVACIASCAQIYAVVGAGFILVFIVRDLGSPDIAGWVIQGPLLIQCALSPVIGRLSDALSRKYLAAIPPLLGVAGSVISAKATSMTTLIGGGILIGTTISTIGIIQAIPSEVLPLKFRPLANGLMYLSGTLGGVLAILAPGAFTNASLRGWRNAFWLQAGLHICTSLGLLFGYNPIRGSDYGKLSWKQIFWICDPIGSSIFIVGSALVLLSLDWAGTSYSWSSPHVAAPFVIGLAFIALFCIYEWKARSDGLLPHILFKGSPNFALAIIAFTLEGWVFYSAINNVLPTSYLNLGFESSAWRVSVRQLTLSLPTIVFSLLIVWYATKFGDLRSPLVLSYVALLAVSIAYCFLTPSWSIIQYGLNVVCSIGIAGPFTLLTAIIQYSTPHAYLSTATGIAFSSRAIGGALGSSILNTIINNNLKAYPTELAKTAIGAGLPPSSVPDLLQAFATGVGLMEVSGLSPAILGVVVTRRQGIFAHAYRLAWISIVPFAAVALVCVCFLKGVKDLMTERIEAPIERVENDPIAEKA